MKRPINIITTGALALSLALPTGAVAMSDLHPQASGDEATNETVAAPTYRDLRSPDARDAARASGPTQVTYRDLRSPDARDAAANPQPAPVTVADAPESGFDFGDAGIGAAGLLGLLGIGFGTTLLVGKRRRLHVAH